jgi:hypothetical protein
MPADPGAFLPAEAQQTWTGESEPNARTHYLPSCVSTREPLLQPKRNGLFRDIYPRNYHCAVAGIAGAAAHRPFTSGQLVPWSLKPAYLLGFGKLIPC